LYLPAGRWHVILLHRRNKPQKERGIALFYTVTLNPALDIFIDAPDFQPGTVNLAAGLRRVWGGKGLNVARILKDLGASCAAFGIACGSTGDALVAGLSEAGIPADFVRAPGETRTNVKITDPNAGVTTDVNQPGPKVPQSALDELFERLTSRVGAGDTVALCGSLPKGVWEGIYGEWTRELKALGVTVALDASKNALRQGLFAGPDIVKPNLFELSELVGREIHTAKDALWECQKIVDAGTGLVALSLGEAGALFVRKDAHAFVPGLRVEVCSTTGAGDALLAALLVALNREDGLSEAGAFAVSVSAAHVSTPPGSPLQGERIGELFAQVKENMARSGLESAF
jgi:1-phosphofructokinase